MTAREQWKREHRHSRVVKRESLKAMKDAMLYGTGAVYIPNTGEPRHIPIKNLTFPLADDKHVRIIQLKCEEE